MALAARFGGLLREERVRHQPELARLAHVTQPRMTQIIILLDMAPDIQGKVLLLSNVTSRRDPVHERMSRKVCSEIDWSRQRRKWAELCWRALGAPS
jgi:hypothetical protein